MPGDRRPAFRRAAASGPAVLGLPAKSFEAIAVVWARASERVAATIMWNQHMADFWMQHAVQQVAIDHHAAANTGANRDIHKGVDILRCAPALLAKRRRVHIGIEANWHAEFACWNTPTILGVRPTWLRRRCNRAIGWRGRVQINWAE